VDLSEEGWQEKARAIRHASGHAMISASSARDLARLFPEVAEPDIAVAHCGLPPGFSPATPDEIADARRANGVTGDYLLMVGDRNGAGGYKNGILAFRAAALAAKQGRTFEIVCVGGAPEIEAEFRAAAPGVKARRIKANDETLRRLYSGAHALVYPSRYEGFGMPVLEAMACGCPVVTCANSSLIEVGGQAAIFVDPDDAEAAVAALVELADPATRVVRRAAGLDQAARFTTAAQAATAMAAFRSTLAAVEAGTRPRPGPGWQEFRRYQAGIQGWLTESPGLARGARSRGAGGSTGRVAGELQRALMEVQAMKNSPFWKLRGAVIAALRRLGLRQRG
jgi:hypothetical protein